MEKLTKTEEPVMQIIWRLRKVFVKDIIKELPDPKPPYNTISSIVRILESKGMVGHEAFGKTYRYYPKVSINQYRRLVFNTLLKNYFDDSYTNLMSFIIQDEELSEKDISELREMINKLDDE